MIRYQDASPIQIAAFHRSVFGFAWLILGLILRFNHLISADQSKVFLYIWQFLLYSGVLVLLHKRTEVEPRTQTSQNLEYVRAIFGLTKSFFQSSPISNGFVYRTFRAVLGAFLVLFLTAMTAVLVPLIAFEILLCRLKSLTATTGG